MDEDCNRLLSQFEQRKSLAFAAFRDVWRACEFSVIFRSLDDDCPEQERERLFHELSSTFLCTIPSAHMNRGCWRRSARLVS